MDTLKLILLIFQMISCVVLTVVIILQNGAEDGLGAIAPGIGIPKSRVFGAPCPRLDAVVALRTGDTQVDARAPIRSGTELRISGEITDKRVGSHDFEPFCVVFIWGVSNVAVK